MSSQNLERAKTSLRWCVEFIQEKFPHLQPFDFRIAKQTLDDMAHWGSFSRRDQQDLELENSYLEDEVCRLKEILSRVNELVEDEV